MSNKINIPGWPETAAGMPFVTGTPNAPNNVFANGLAGGMDFIKNFWGNTPSTVPGFVVPTIDLKELEKRIKDLKAVEGWLDVNLNMLRTTIQALEVQHSTIATIHAMSDTISANTDAAAKGMMASMQSPAEPAASPVATPFRFGRTAEPEAPRPRKRKAKAKAPVNAGLPPGWPAPTPAAPVAKAKPVTVQPAADAPVSVKPAAKSQAVSPAKAPAKAPSKAATKTDESPLARGAEQAAASAGAWMNFLQDQFSKVATTALSGTGTTATPAKTAAKKVAGKAVNKSAGKAAVKAVVKSRR